MILTMDGWINFIKKPSLQRRLSKSIMMLSAFLCLSCGKKIVNKSSPSPRPKKAKIKGQSHRELLPITIQKKQEQLQGTHFLNKRAFLTLTRKIQVSSPQIHEAHIYFHTKNNQYEFKCHFEKKASRDLRFLYLTECTDQEQGEVTDTLKISEHYLPAQEEIYIEALGENLPHSSTVFLPLTRK